MLVLKFGGTSVQDAAALRRVVAIVLDKASTTQPIVCVLSATSGTTSDLLDLAHLSRLHTTDVVAWCNRILNRHTAIARELISDADFQQQAVRNIDEIVSQLRNLCQGIQLLQECTSESLDAVASFGERLSTGIFYHALAAAGAPVSAVSATSVIKTNSAFTRATVNMEATRVACTAVLLPLLSPGNIVVTEGFTGSDASGRTTTLGRGGSDASAAILGAALGAESIEIWTDVSGVYTADPRIVPAARPITTLSFPEIRELALFGAKVLHPDTLLPAVEENIPVVIRNTFAPGDPGTTITSSHANHAPIHAVSLVRLCSVVQGTRRDLDVVYNVDVVQRITLLRATSAEHAILIAHTPDAQDQTTVAVACADISASITQGSVIAITGPGVSESTVISRITSAVAEYTIRAFIVGASPYTSFIVAPEADAVQILQAIHRLIEV